MWHGFLLRPIRIGLRECVVAIGRPTEKSIRRAHSVFGGPSYCLILIPGTNFYVVTCKFYASIRRYCHPFHRLFQEWHRANAWTKSRNWSKSPLCKVSLLVCPTKAMFWNFASYTTNMTLIGGIGNMYVLICTLSPEYLLLPLIFSLQLPFFSEVDKVHTHPLFCQSSGGRGLIPPKSLRITHVGYTQL